MIMTLSEHQVAAAATMNPVLAPREKIANCGLGLSCEVLELSQWIWPRKNYYVRLPLPWSIERALEVTGELGDLCWYSAVLADSYGRLLSETSVWRLDKICSEVDVAEVTQLPVGMDAYVVEQAFFELCDHAEVACGLVKWHVFHHHEWTDEVGEKIRNALRGVILQVQRIAAAGRLGTLGEVLYANIEKLKRRYPSGHFTAEDSANRSD